MSTTKILRDSQTGLGALNLDPDLNVDELNARTHADFGGVALGLINFPVKRVARRRGRAYDQMRAKKLELIGVFTSLARHHDRRELPEEPLDWTRDGDGLEIV